MKIYANDFDECRKLIHENFSDKNIVFIIAESYDFSFASFIANIIKTLKAITIGILFVVPHYLLLEFTELSKSFYDTVLFSMNPQAGKLEREFIKYIIDSVNRTECINLDFNDIRHFFKNAGCYVLSTGYFGGHNKIAYAAQ